jgi:CspA family cold shock protein
LRGFGPSRLGGSGFSCPIRPFSARDLAAAADGFRQSEATMATGTVKVWSKSGGYGWIKPDGLGDNVYVHKSGIAEREGDRAPSLEPGARVEYQIGSRPKGAAAVNVRVVTSEPTNEGDEATS